MAPLIPRAPEVCTCQGRASFCASHSPALPKASYSVSAVVVGSRPRTCTLKFSAGCGAVQPTSALPWSLHQAKAQGFKPNRTKRSHAACTPMPVETTAPLKLLAPRWRAWVWICHAEATVGHAALGHPPPAPPAAGAAAPLAAPPAAPPALWMVQPAGRSMVQLLGQQLRRPARRSPASAPPLAARRLGTQKRPCRRCKEGKHANYRCGAHPPTLQGSPSPGAPGTSTTRQQPGPHPRLYNRTMLGRRSRTDPPRPQARFQTLCSHAPAAARHPHPRTCPAVHRNQEGGEGKPCMQR